MPVSEAEYTVTTVPDTEYPVEQLRRKSAHGLALLLLRNVVTISLNLAGTVLLTRASGPELWGAFSAALFLYMAAQEVLVRGFAGHLIRLQYSPSQEEIRSTFAVANLVGLLMFVGACLAGPMATRFYPGTSIPLLLAAGGFSSWTMAWRGTSVALLERRLRYTSVIAIEVGDTAVYAVSAVFLVHALGPPAGLAAALVLRGLLPAMLAYGLQRFPVAIVPEKRFLASIIGYGSVMSGISLISVATMAVPAFVLAPLAGAAAVGSLQLAFSILGNLFFAASALTRLCLSTYARMSDPRQIADDVSGKLRFLPLLLAPPVAIFLGASPFLIPHIFGAKWNAVPALLLMAGPGYLLAAVSWPVMTGALLARRAPRLLLAVPVLQCLILAVSIAFGAHRWGALSGAFGYTAGQVVSFLPLLWLYSSAFRKPPISTPLLSVAGWCAAAVLLFLCFQNGRITEAVAITAICVALWIGFGFRRALGLVRTLFQKPGEGAIAS